MKKPNIAIVVTVLMVSLSGIIFMSKTMNNKKDEIQNADKSESGVQTDSKPLEQSDDITFNEYTFKISEDEIITAKYLKSGQTIRIYSLSPVVNKNSYDISSSGSSALYLSRDESIWRLYNDGTEMKISQDKYQAIQKSDVIIKHPDYIWADKPEFTVQGTVRFVSNLPDLNDSPKKSIWEVNQDGSSMKMIYTPSSNDYKVLGDRDDERLMILDGESIAAVDTVSLNVETIEVKDKYIINMSPLGTRLLFAKKDGDNKPDFGSLFVMDSTGKSVEKIPHIEGYTATEMGAWNNDGSKYAFIAKSSGGSKYRIHVVSFDDNLMTINEYSTAEDTKFPDGCIVKWTNDTSISIDIGDGIISMDIQ